MGDAFFNGRGTDLTSRVYSSRIRYIQEVITTRAIELLALPHGVPAYILDIGCGSGISGQVLQEAGHVWVGVDISEPMLGTCEIRGIGKLD